jgi:putative SOS response-associated peptidase YedK
LNENEKVRNRSGKLANQPYYHFSPGEPAIAIAGLWSAWPRQEADPLLSCALITKDAAHTLAHVHHRMPVILRPEHFSAWLDPRTPLVEVQAIIADAREDFEVHAVSVDVNNGRNDGAELIERIREADTLF